MIDSNVASRLLGIKGVLKVLMVRLHCWLVVPYGFSLVGPFLCRLGCSTSFSLSVLRRDGPFQASALVSAHRRSLLLSDRGATARSLRKKDLCSSRFRMTAVVAVPVRRRLTQPRGEVRLGVQRLARVRGVARVESRRTPFPPLPQFPSSACDTSSPRFRSFRTHLPPHEASHVSAALLLFRPPPRGVSRSCYG